MPRRRERAEQAVTLELSIRTAGPVRDVGRRHHMRWLQIGGAADCPGCAGAFEQHIDQ